MQEACFTKPKKDTGKTKTLKKTGIVMDGVQKRGGECALDNFEEKFRNLKDSCKQRTAITHKSTQISQV